MFTYPKYSEAAKRKAFFMRIGIRYQITAVPSGWRLTKGKFNG